MHSHCLDCGYSHIWCFFLLGTAKPWGKRISTFLANYIHDKNMVLISMYISHNPLNTCLEIIQEKQDFVNFLKQSLTFLREVVSCYFDCRNWIPIALVKAEYPNQLDYNGLFIGFWTHMSLTPVKLQNNVFSIIVEYNFKRDYQFHMEIWTRFSILNIRVSLIIY